MTEWPSWSTGNSEISLNLTIWTNAQPRIIPGKWDTQSSARRPDLVINQKKKRTCRIVDVATPADHKANFKENEKREKYLVSFFLIYVWGRFNETEPGL